MSEEKPTTVAPYGPFSTFETGLNHLAALKGLPPKIDRSVFPSMGGDAKTHVLNALRYFDLIDAGGVPQQSLKDLALEKDARKATMRQILKDYYPNISELDLGTMTISQLDSKLGEKRYNVSGGTRQKARSFLLKAAEFAGIPLSGLLTQKGPRGPREQRKKRTKPNGERVEAKFTKVDEKGNKLPDPPLDPDVLRMPIPLGPDRIAQVELPKDWNEKDAKKLLAMLGLALDVSVSVS